MSSDLRERTVCFAGFLHSLESPEHRTARAVLADLRSGLGKQPGEAARAWRHIVPFLEDREADSDRWFFLAGTLFPLHPKSLARDERRRSLGGSFGRIRKALTESGEARFLALLNADHTDLAGLLRGAISLLHTRGEDVGVDWARLICDLDAWDHPDRHVQAKWAREYYRADDRDSLESDPEEKE